MVNSNERLKLILEESLRTKEKFENMKTIVNLGNGDINEQKIFNMFLSILNESFDKLGYPLRGFIVKSYRFDYDQVKEHFGVVPTYNIIEKNELETWISYSTDFKNGIELKTLLETNTLNTLIHGQTYETSINEERYILSSETMCHFVPVLDSDGIEIKNIRDADLHQLYLNLYDRKENIIKQAFLNTEEMVNDYRLKIEGRYQYKQIADMIIFEGEMNSTSGNYIFEQDELKQMGIHNKDELNKVYEELLNDYDNVIDIDKSSFEDGTLDIIFNLYRCQNLDIGHLSGERAIEYEWYQLKYNIYNKLEDNNNQTTRNRIYNKLDIELEQLKKETIINQLVFLKYCEEKIQDLGFVYLDDAGNRVSKDTQGAKEYSVIMEDRIRNFGLCKVLDNSEEENSLLFVTEDGKIIDTPMIDSGILCSRMEFQKIDPQFVSLILHYWNEMALDEEIEESLLNRQEEVEME